MKSYKYWLCAAVAMLMLLSVGCSAGTTTPTATPEGSVDATGEASTQPTTAPSAMGDSIFGDEEFGDNRPAENPGKETEKESGKQSDEASGNTGNNSEESTGNNGSGESTQPTNPLPKPGEMTYEEFIKLTPAEQRAYQASFGEGTEGLDAFFAWYNAAKEQYEKDNPPTEIGGNGVVELD